MRQLGGVGRILKDLSAGAAPVRPATARVRQQGAEAHAVAGDLGKRGAGELQRDHGMGRKLVGAIQNQGTPDPPKCYVCWFRLSSSEGSLSSVGLDDSSHTLEISTCSNQALA